MTENIAEDYSQWIEIASMSDYITQYGSGSSLTDIKLADLYKYLQNPYSNIKEIQKASKYLTNKHGIIKDVLRTIRSLPTLNYHLNWSSYEDVKKIKKYEQKIHEFLENINVKKVVRDGLLETSEIGTLVMCLRNNKYIQFLDLDDLRIIKQRNGKWVIEYDLQAITTYSKFQDKLAIIESLPDEVTVEKFNLYKNKGEDYRYVELKNCDLVNIDARRTYPYGLPFTIGAWGSLLQKEIINRVERSTADRMIKQILILSAGTMDKDGQKPAPKPMIQSYFNEISKLLQKKEQLGSRSHNDSSGTGLIAIPSFFELKGLDIDVQMFKKEVYDKLDNEIYSNLGVSPALISGNGGNYSSAQLNGEKLMRYIFSIIEDFETIINQYIKSILPANLNCRFYFDRTTILNRDKQIAHFQNLYQQMGIAQPLLESLLGVPYHYALGQAQYEKKVLGTQDILYPPLNANTMSGSDNPQGGRPEETDSGNENTNKTRSNGANNSPAPSK